jgi:uncharacterized integral membrane protein
VIGWGTRKVDRPETIALWARRRGIVVTPHNAALVRWYVPLAGTLRVVGAVSGAVVGSLADRALGVDTSAGAGFWMWVVLGWMTGGWWAAQQIAGALPSDGGALLVARTDADYAPGTTRWGPIVGSLALAAVAIGGAVVTEPTGWTALALASAAIAPAAAHRTARRTIDRRQPAAHPDLLAADDAIRSTTVQLIGAGTTAALLLAAAALWATAMDEVDRLPFGLRGWPLIVLLLGGYLAGTYLANRPWRVRRTPITHGAP